MIRKSLLTVILGVGLLGLMSSPSALAFDRYNDGCNSCHGAFTDGTSTKGSTFPGDDKHTMHRSSQNMNTKCELCHRSDDGNNPFIGSSAGTALNPGIGCTGCHPAAGLRLHHVNNGVETCTDGACHNPNGGPAENIKPIYYGTADTNVNNPCNPTATAKLNENWTLDGFEGSDTDGDNLYDLADPDCQGTSTTPGEAGKAPAPVLVTAYNKVSGALTISYGVACASTTNHIEHGLIPNVKTYTYAGQVCALGNTGTATFTVPDGSFFLVVADNATNEGSYGKRRIAGAVTERPEDTTSVTCQKAQDLAARCDP